MAQKADSRKRRPAVRRDLLESLEARQLMAGFNANFSFRNTYQNVPAGYTADVGKPFAWQGAYEQGWNSNNNANTVNRGSATARTDTFAYIGRAGGATKWEVSVPNGNYTVQVTAGDSSEVMGHYGIAVEGTTIVDATPTWNARWADGAGIVTVADGRLTVTSAPGAWNNKITSIQIAQITSSTPIPTEAGGEGISPNALPRVPGWTSSWAAGTTVGVGWQDGSSNETGYIVERSTDGWTWGEVARVGANTTTTSITGQNAWTGYAFRVKGFNARGTTSASPATWVTTGAASPVSPTWNPAPTPAPTPTPATPAPTNLTWASAGAAGTDKVTIIWGDVSNETGYTVQRSTDGWTYGEVGRVGANVTTYTNSGLNASTKYYYRIQAYNGAGTSNTLSTDATTNAPVWTPPAPAPTPTPGPTTPGYYNKPALKGIVPNQIAASQAIPMLQQLGADSVRLWYGINGWNDGVNQWDVNAVRQYKQAGFKVVLAVCTPVVPDPNTAKAMFQRLGSSELGGLVDYWEINNEPNHNAYWYGTLQQYVNNMLKPAYEALHALGKTVIGGGLTFDVAAAVQLASYGYANYCDYTNFHPYGETGAIVVQRAAAAKAAFGNKPMIVTEWNIVGNYDLNTWAREISVAASGLSQVTIKSYYYALVVDWSVVGRAGAYNTDGSRNTAIFNAIYSWIH